MTAEQSPVVNEAAPSPFMQCPVCGSVAVMRLVPEWNDGRAIPIVGCGNPWHYDQDDTASLGRAHA